jgi:soluble lytic murein transglycosylase-like protein
VRYFTSLTYGPNHARVSADYIRALILVESAGLRTAESPRGAKGLTQILPQTAQLALAELARDGVDYLYIDERVFRNFHPDDLYDPALNILIACHLSATYHAMYDGDTELIVSAWNAGPGAVARYGNQPPPYDETRGMIGRILGYLTYLDEVDDL